MKRFGFLTAAAVLWCGSAAAMHYDIQVGLRPEAHRLDATVIVRDPPSERFFVYKNFKVQSVLADGKPVAFHIDPSIAPSPFSPGGVAVVTEAKGAKTLEIRYGGTIDEPVATVNMISPDVVELATYTSWYPFFSNDAIYTFNLTVAAPQGFMVAANAKQMWSKTSDGRFVSSWSTYEPTFDVALFAAPDMKTSAAGSPRIEIDYKTLPDAAMNALRDNVATARAKTVALLGKPHVDAGFRAIFSPHPGWGYSRPPIVFVAEEAIKKIQARGDSEVFHGVVHEMAHHWWTIAKTDGVDNWLNEGTAEYTAVRLTQELYGDATLEPILNDFRGNATRNKTSDAIAETVQQSDDRYLNQYQRPTLMFFAAREKFGARGLDALLRALHQRFAGTHDATTAAFLELARQHMGPEAAAFFKEELYRRYEVAKPVSDPQNGAK